MEGQKNEEVERHLECSACTKPTKIIYTVVNGELATDHAMCISCPLLKRHLEGIDPKHSSKKKGKKRGIACKTCGTTLESVLAGGPLQCASCYEIFSDVLTHLLTDESSKESDSNQKQVSHLHIGKTPGARKELDVSLRLLALNEALKTTLSREDYEQAALIRDEIKKLTEHQK